MVASLLFVFSAVAMCTDAVNGSICDLCLAVNAELAALCHNALCPVQPKANSSYWEMKPSGRKMKTRLGMIRCLIKAGFLKLLRL